MRTQESTLHGLSLLGGWPGALIAQQVLRHKSKKGVEGLVAKSVGLFPERLCAQHQPGIGAMSDFAKTSMFRVSLINCSNRDLILQAMSG